MGRRFGAVAAGAVALAVGLGGSSPPPHPRWAVEKRIVQSELSSTERAIAHSIASHLNQSGVAWPSVDEIAAKTGFHRSTVFRALPRIERTVFEVRRRWRREDREPFEKRSNVYSAPYAVVPIGIREPAPSDAARKPTTPPPEPPPRSPPKSPASPSPPLEPVPAILMTALEARAAELGEHDRETFGRHLLRMGRQRNLRAAAIAAAVHQAADHAGACTEDHGDARVRVARYVRAVDPNDRPPQPPAPPPAPKVTSGPDPPFVDAAAALASGHLRRPTPRST